MSSNVKFFFGIILIASMSAHALARDAIDAKNCQSCHQQAISDWQTSDHAKAMDIASSSSVLGDFSDVTHSHFSQKARFYKKNDQFFIDFSEQGKLTTYKVD